MAPVVSILIPCYNAELWVGCAIESALSQTWPTKEIVVLYDGSTDGSLEVVKRFGDHIRWGDRSKSRRQSGAQCSSPSSFLHDAIGRLADDSIRRMKTGQKHSIQAERTSRPTSLGKSFRERSRNSSMLA